MKRCTRCSESKPASEFYETVVGSGKLKSWCKKCCGNASRRTYARRFGVYSTTYTDEEWIGLRDFYDNRCLRCGSTEALVPDHVIPPSRGGTNDISNIQPLCLPCNSSKGDNTTDYRPGAGRKSGESEE